jgi:hypothetical protein
VTDEPIKFPGGVTPRSDKAVAAPEGAAPPKLLRVPTSFQSVAEVLACADKMNLPNVLVLSEREDGSIVFLDSGMNFAQTNWLLDRMKMILLGPGTYELKAPRPSA